MKQFRFGSLELSTLACLLQVFSSQASAAAAPIVPYPLSCQEADSLKDSVKSCGDNEILVEAGVHCVMQIEALVKEKSAVLKKKLEELRTANHQQKEKMQEAQQSYAAQEQELRRLIATAKTASKSIRGYLDNVIFPDHWDHEAEIKDYGKFFDSEQCYAEPREILFETLEDVDIILSDLGDTLDLTLGLQNKSQTRKTGFDSDKKLEKASGGKNAPKALTKTGKSKKAGNTITGIKEDEKKRQQAPKK